ncbi:MAG: MFS transporter [Phycicoccus sp.]|jgi:MFS family permease|uniref:MFS transporter n=1 Tax=Phycicoccus sp. TaxID=1902410 RepID=UPI00258CECD7|nr:MFS transporter [Phycicoccus sp.]MBK8729007.1 MFS transporter [Tetrasphaera sp.]MCA0322383.1 MFS transporter [Actinomycetota bacterium]MCO5303187.1 MFS transporter [Phycicoccus sp.]
MTTLPTVTEKPRIPREIWVLIAAAFVIAIGFGLITPVLPSFARSFDVGVTASSIIVSAFAFFRLVFAPAGGRLIAKFGERPIYITGLLIVAISTGATAFAQSYWQVLLFRSLGGIGSTMFTVSAVALIVRLAPPTIRGRVSSAYGSAFLLGGIGGPVLGGLLGNLGLRIPFLVYAVALVIAAAIVAAMIRTEALRPAADAPQRAVFTVREALQDSAYRASMGSAVANGWANFGVRNAILPLFATAVILDEPWVAGAALAVFAAGNAVGLTFSGRLSDRIGRRPFIIGGLLVSGLATMITGWVGTLPLLILVSAVAGLGAGVLNPAQQASIADIVRQDRNGGPAIAAVQMSSDLGSIIGPIIAGVLVDEGSYGLAFAVTGLIGLLAVIPWLRARETANVA